MTWLDRLNCAVIPPDKVITTLFTRFNSEYHKIIVFPNAGVIYCDKSKTDMSVRYLSCSQIGKRSLFKRDHFGGRKM